MGKGKFRKQSKERFQKQLLANPGRGEREILMAARSIGLNPQHQRPVGPYFADLAFLHHNVVIEVDGASHVVGGIKDAARDEYFRNQGWSVYRVASKVAVEQPMAVLVTVLGVEPLKAWARELERIACNPPSVHLLPSHVPTDKAVVAEKRAACPITRTPSWVPLTSKAAAQADGNHRRRKRLNSDEYRALMKKIDKHQKRQREQKTKQPPKEHDRPASVAADQDAGLQSAGNTMGIFAPTKPA